MALTDTAIILAGGRSSRMGFDKQLIKIGNITVIEYIISNLKPLFANIIIVTNNYKLYNDKDLVILEDIHKGLGPIGGIHAGLTESKSVFNYVIACDMPYININYIEYMLKILAESNYHKDGVITRCGDWIEPFNAFYNKNLLFQIENNINEGKKKISDLLINSDILYIEEHIAKQFSPDWSMFTNLNREKDLEILNKIIGR